MRQKLLIVAILTAVCLFSLFCSRSDVITGAGESVVADMDSTLTNARGFVRINLDATAADSAFSLPAAAEPLFGTHLVTGSLPVGLNADGDTIAAHTQFIARPFGAGTGARYAADDELKGAYIYFSAADSASSEPMPVFRSETLLGVSPIDRNRADAACREDSESCEITLDGAGAVDSIRLTDDVARELFAARVSQDTSVSVSAAYTVMNYHGELRHINIPRLVIHVTKNDGSEVRDTLLQRAARFTTFERDAAERAEHPYSSFYTKRTAVFRINVGKIIDSLAAIGLSGGRNEILNAVLSVRYEKPVNNDDGNSENSGNNGNFADTLKAVSYRMIALDTLLTEEAETDSAAAVSKRLLWDAFAATGSTAPAVSTPNVHSVKTALRSVLDKDDGNRYIYVYFRPVADGGMMLWRPPQRVETIFTPSRSQ